MKFIKIALFHCLLKFKSQDDRHHSTELGFYSMVVLYRTITIKWRVALPPSSWKACWKQEHPLQRAKAQGCRHINETDTVSKQSLPTWIPAGAITHLCPIPENVGAIMKNVKHISYYHSQYEEMAVHKTTVSTSSPQQGIIKSSLGCENVGVFLQQ